MTRRVDVRVTGRVQGVSYRAYAARQAERLGVGGWVRNEADGSVTAQVEGDDDAVAAMLEWCEHGSPGAEVERVEVRNATPMGTTSFRIES